MAIYPATTTISCMGTQRRAVDLGWKAQRQQLAVGSNARTWLLGLGKRSDKLVLIGGLAGELPKNWNVRCVKTNGPTPTSIARQNQLE